MIETRLLHYFLAIAREQSITRAAQTLFLSQSTLSKQMMDLERQLGKQLFHRGKRRITLTEDGVFLRNRAQEILELLENTEAALHTEGGHPSGGTSPSPAGRRRPWTGSPACWRPFTPSTPR